MLSLHISTHTYYRHDVAQIAGMTAISFGVEDIDRYIVVYKKDLGPSDDEVAARRNGDEWNGKTAEKYAQMVSYCFLIRRHSSEQLFNMAIYFCLLAQRVEEQQKEEERNAKTEVVVPNSNYKDKYVHLIGQDAAIDAAKKTESNKSYGFGEFLGNSVIGPIFSKSTLHYGKVN